MKKNKKPNGWWITHYTLLRIEVHGGFDGNGDMLGDFPGLIKKLDEIKEMGFTGFRFQHVGPYGDDYQYAGLVLQDWFNIDPRYGTMKDFEKFIAECEKRDIKVIMMLIPEYVGWQHPDYLSALNARKKGIDDPRVDWFLWKDDGTVITCWDKPGINTENKNFQDAFLKHIKFWMNKGIAGWDIDAVPSWINVKVETVQRFNEYVKKLGGFICPENYEPEKEIIRNAGFNAGSGALRTELYNEIKAILQGKADIIRQGLAARNKIIASGLFAFQEFGGNSFSSFCRLPYGLEMYKLQVAFNAVLPDQIWMNAAALTYNEYRGGYNPYETECRIMWEQIEREKENNSSSFNHVKRMLNLRRQHKTLAVGEMKEIKTSCPKEIFAAIRTSEDGEKRALVIFNFSNTPQDVTINLEKENIKGLKNLLNDQTTELKNATLRVNLNFFGYKFYDILNSV